MIRYKRLTKYHYYITKNHSRRNKPQNQFPKSLECTIVIQNFPFEIGFYVRTMHGSYFHQAPIISLASIIKIDEDCKTGATGYRNGRFASCSFSCLEGWKNSLTISPTDSPDKITDLWPQEIALVPITRWIVPSVQSVPSTFWTRCIAQLDTLCERLK